MQGIRFAHHLNTTLFNQLWFLEEEFDLTIDDPVPDEDEKYGAPLESKFSICTKNGYRTNVA